MDFRDTGKGADMENDTLDMVADETATETKNAPKKDGPMSNEDTLIEKAAGDNSDAPAGAAAPRLSSTLFK